MTTNIKSIALLLLMLVTSELTTLLRPTKSVADTLPPINLAEMVPSNFSNWEGQPNIRGEIVDPSQKYQLEKIYSETLSRTYVASNGYRIMLSIAYGKNQSGNFQLHRPEVCYPAQGFQVLSSEIAIMQASGLDIPIAKMNTRLGNRTEPLIYWTVIGDKTATSMKNKRLIELRYAIHGYIPDGMVVRISSIDPNPTNAFAMQYKFAQEMIQAIDPKYRSRFSGS